MTFQAVRRAGVNNTFTFSNSLSVKYFHLAILAGIVAGIVTSVKYVLVFLVQSPLG